MSSTWPNPSNPPPGPSPLPHRGRGALRNPPNRFEPLILEPEPDWNPEEEPAPRTQFFRDCSQSIISTNDSPDIPYGATLNPYRGCEHGCAYCYARPTHEYLGFSAGLDFETKIMVKTDAAELLRRHLTSRKWKPEPIGLCGVTDPYQPAERRFQLTRQCLQVLAEFRNPVGIVTKNRLVTRDLDVLQELAKFNAVAVSLSINSLDADLARCMEPRTSSPRARLQAIEQLARAGIPVGVMVAPIIPALNDHEIPTILQAARNAGALWAGMEMLRLPLTVAPVFQDWLLQNYPAKQEKVLGRIRAVRGGKLNDPRFGHRMRGEGIFAEQISRVFRVARSRAGFEGWRELSVESFRRPAPPSPQMQWEF